MTEIPFEVALSMNNSAGYLFGNRHLGVCVQRWTDLENFGEAVTLVDYMFEEMAFTGGDTVVIDVSSLEAQSDSELYQFALTLFCITGEHVKRVALVGMTPELRNQPGFAQLVRRAAALDVIFVQSEDFPEAMSLLNESAQAANRAALPQDTPAGAENTYGGSVAYWPTHATVVLTLAGNDGDLAATEQALESAIQSVRDNGAKALVVDTTASAPVNDAERLKFIQDKALPVLSQLGLAYFIHVRPETDKLVRTKDAPDVGSRLRAAGISYERKANLAEASVHLDKLAGLLPSSTKTSSVLH